MRQPKSKADKEVGAAQALWSGQVCEIEQMRLRQLVEDYGFSISAGDIQLLRSRWYVTHAGLLRLAKKSHCNGIHTEVLPSLSDPAVSRWVVKETVYKTAKSKGFVGYGDADPNNVSLLVRGAELRIAETRAVNRALRKAYGIGLCSVEELGASKDHVSPRRNDHNGNNGHDRSDGHDAQPSRLRDRLLLLIRQHGLEAGQVKGFAEAFCGNKPLREATRQDVEAFLKHLTELVTENREQALEVLGRYAVAPKGDGATPQAADADQVNTKEAA